MANKIKKKHAACLIASVLIILLTGLISGCGASASQGSSKNPSLSEIENGIASQMDLKEMIKLDNDKLQKIYDISPDKLEGFSVYISDSNALADELAIIKVKDKNDVSAVMDKINKRVESQEKGFKDYIPEEYFKIQKHVLKNKGEYILLVISKDPDKVENAFDKAFK